MCPPSVGSAGDRNPHKQRNRHVNQKRLETSLMVPEIMVLFEQGVQNKSFGLKVMQGHLIGYDICHAAQVINQ